MKQRRDITLGEMQDECIRRSNDGKTCAGCDYSFVCPVALGKEMCPKLWFLIDPPRFNESQMELLKGLYANGVMKLRSDCAITSLFREDHEYIGNLINSQIGIELSDGETLDLAELLGKDAT